MDQEARLDQIDETISKLNQIDLLDTIDNPHKYMYSAYNYSAHSYLIKKTGGVSATSNNFIYYRPI